MPFCMLADGTADGAVKDNCYGTYLHGLFDNGELTCALADCLLRQKGLPPVSFRPERYHNHQEQQIRMLADAVRTHLDMRRVYEIIDAW